MSSRDATTLYITVSLQKSFRSGESSLLESVPPLCTTDSHTTASEMSFIGLKEVIEIFGDKENKEVCKTDLLSHAFSLQVHLIFFRCFLKVWFSFPIFRFRQASFTTSVSWSMNVLMSLRFLFLMARKLAPRPNFTFKASTLHLNKYIKILLFPKNCFPP